MKPYWLVAILVVAGCGAKKAADEGDDAAAPVSVKVAVVKAADVRSILTLDGSYAPAEGQYAKLAPMTPGRVTRLLVREGDHVSAGQLLATVDVRVLAAQSQSAQVATATANAQAAQSALSLRAAQADQSAAVETARLGLETARAERESDVTQARLDLAKLRAGARPQEIAQAEQAVNQARVTRDKAKEDAQRNQSLAADGYVAGQDAKAAQATYELAESSLKQAEAQLDLLRVGARAEDLRAAEVRLRSAQTLGAKKVALAEAALRQAQQGQLAVAAKGQDAVAARLTASQKAADQQAALQTLRNGEIHAPFAGVVTARLLNVGDSADTTTPIFEMAAEHARMDFVASASAEDAAKLAVGMVANFDGDGDGVVRSIGIANGQTGLVTVRIQCGPRTSTKQGTFARAKVVLRTYRQIPSVPPESVLTRDGQAVVFVAQDKTAKQTAIERGPEDGGLVAVLKGVKVGDSVVLLGQHELSDGSKIEVDAPQSKGEEK